MGGHRGQRMLGNNDAVRGGDVLAPGCDSPPPVARAGSRAGWIGVPRRGPKCPPAPCLRSHCRWEPAPRRAASQPTVTPRAVPPRPPVLQAEREEGQPGLALNPGRRLLSRVWACPAPCPGAGLPGPAPRGAGSSSRPARQRAPHPHSAKSRVFSSRAPRTCCRLGHVHPGLHACTRVRTRRPPRATGRVRASLPLDGVGLHAPGPVAVCPGRFPGRRSWHAGCVSCAHHPPGLAARPAHLAGHTCPAHLAWHAPWAGRPLRVLSAACPVAALLPVPWKGGSGLFSIPKVQPVSTGARRLSGSPVLCPGCSGCTLAGRAAQAGPPAAFPRDRRPQRPHTCMQQLCPPRSSPSATRPLSLHTAWPGLKGEDRPAVTRPHDADPGPPHGLSGHTRPLRCHRGLFPASLKRKH